MSFLCIIAVSLRNYCTDLFSPIDNFNYSRSERGAQFIFICFICFIFVLIENSDYSFSQRVTVTLQFTIDPLHCLYCIDTVLLVDEARVTRLKIAAPFPAFFIRHLGYL